MKLQILLMQKVRNIKLITYIKKIHKYTKNYIHIKVIKTLKYTLYKQNVNVITYADKMNMSVHQV